jgi:hypothetical protein
MSRDDLEDGECRGMWVATDPQSNIDNWLGYSYSSAAKWQAAKAKNFNTFKKAGHLARSGRDDAWQLVLSSSR